MKERRRQNKNMRGNGGHGDDMPGMSSLATNLSVDSIENEKEPPVEITAVGLMPTNSMLPKSTKATKKECIA
ncbi:hypothetical protein F2Q69_00045482 [Brassica cretica]|uniref:Uncharacterized protein n=1 Tax=Brassica cretica TaxID=69181 RepID=A0A8S9N9F4_BRACR|nr:hypothetical protein F2Q69_00045482 [Brassica cretica]